MSTPTAYAIILAAGRGSRLRPSTDTTPKPLLRAGGKPLITYGLELLGAHGIHDVVINVHHLREKIITELGDGSAFGMRIRYSVEKELLDTGGGIRQAAALFDAAQHRTEHALPFLVMNADVVTDISLSDLLAEHHRHKPCITLALREDPRASSYGLFGIDPEGAVRRFLGHGASPEGLRELMFASIQVIDPAYIAAMPPTGPFSTMRGLYPEFFAKGVPFHGFRHEGRWYTSDTREDLAELEESLQREGPLQYFRT